MSRGPVIEPREPTREELDRMQGPVLVEFGAASCGYCCRFAPQLAVLLQDHPGVQHIQIEDGPGRPLGRSFRVKLWPTLVFMRDGQIARQLARPTVEDAGEGLRLIADN